MGIGDFEDGATGDQVQTYSDANGTCFTETVVPNGPYTYFDTSGTAVGRRSPFQTSLSSALDLLDVVCLAPPPSIGAKT